MRGKRKSLDVSSTKKRRRLRAAFEREGGRCFYCDRPVILMESGATRPPSGIVDGLRIATIDHIVPRAHGGLTKLENIVCACYHCNHQKHDRSAYAFLAFKHQQKGVLRTG